MKTCPVCNENYDETATEGQLYPEVCAACNDAFGIPSIPPEPPISFPVTQIPPPPPPETPAERHKRLTAKARELLALQFCHQVLCQRVNTDKQHANMWELKDKVALRFADCIRSSLPSEYKTPDHPLSDEEADYILTTHPLLQLKSTSSTKPSLSVDRVRELRRILRNLYLKDNEHPA